MADNSLFSLVLKQNKNIKLISNNIICININYIILRIFFGLIESYIVFFLYSSIDLIKLKFFKISIVNKLVK